MMRFVANTLHPERYQGARRGYPYFEGWYYKLVDASEQHRLAVIPGIYKGLTPATTHAFVQVMDGMSGRVDYFRYPAEAFHAAPNDFDLRIGPNRFRVDRIDLHLEGPERTVKGSLRFNGTHPWPVSLRSPGVMGWYAWMPFMECYHGILSLDHAIAGALEVAGTPIDFTGGRGYAEKDWGRRFPAAWIWFQSNHFPAPETSLTASVALIPWLRGTFRGFIVGLWHAGTLYRFTTYAGAKIEHLQVGDDAVELVLRSPDHRLELHIQRADTAILYAPDLTDMTGRVPETMRSSAQVRLTRLGQPGAPILEEMARNGGLEIVGDIQRLLATKGRGER